MTASVTCPASNPIAVGGGGSTTNGSIAQSFPITGTNASTNGVTANGWRALQTGGNGGSVTTVYVICAK